MNSCQNWLTQSHLERLILEATPLNIRSTEASRGLSSTPFPFLSQKEKDIFVLPSYFLWLHILKCRSCCMSTKLCFKGTAAATAQKLDLFRLAGKTIYQKETIQKFTHF